MNINLQIYFTNKFDEIIGAGESGAVEDCVKVAAYMAGLTPEDAEAVAIEYLEEKPIC